MIESSSTIDSPQAGASPLLNCRNIGQRFGGVVALDGVDFSIQQGEVHGLVGSNGAGKSTLMKILAGGHSDYTGEIEIDGRQVRLGDPLAALDHGIAMVYQELSGIGQLSVAENLFLGRQPTTKWKRVDWKSMNQQAQLYLRELDIDIDVRRRLDTYPLVIRQMVEIARGLHSGARVLILDEPTSALSPPETRRLFSLIEQLRTSNVAIVFISHFIEDVLEICDRVTILRDGKKLQTSATAELDKKTVIHTMLGHDLSKDEIGYETEATLPPRVATQTVLNIQNLSVAGLFQDISFDVQAGECLGLYGFVGAGHQELIHAIAGSQVYDAGQVSVKNSPLKKGDVHAAIEKGTVMVAADRASTLVRSAPIYQNVTVAHLKNLVGNWLTRKKETSVTQPYLAHVGCQPPIPELLAGNLSGGNQQKVVLAKWLAEPIQVLLLEEPTRGMDVGAKEEIMKLILDLKQQGTAVLLASTEPELLMQYADRILTFSRGQITHEFANQTIDKPTLMSKA